MNDTGTKSRGRLGALFSHLRTTFLTCILFSPGLLFAAEGLVTHTSNSSVEDTMNKLEEELGNRGMRVFTRIDHAAGANSVDMDLRPTELLLFGNPRGGTPFMQCNQSVAIDLPMKLLVWQDQSGQVLVGYNDIAYLARRHEIEDCPVVPNLSKALADIIASALGE